jgi:hypothetical protein
VAGGEAIEAVLLHFREEAGSTGKAAEGILQSTIDNPFRRRTPCMLGCHELPALFAIGREGGWLAVLPGQSRSRAWRRRPDRASLKEGAVTGRHRFELRSDGGSTATKSSWTVWNPIL